MFVMTRVLTLCRIRVFMHEYLVIALFMLVLHLKILFVKLSIGV